MSSIDAALAFAHDVTLVKNEADLADLLRQICGELGCSWFALIHHVDFLAAPHRGVRVHNCPEDLAEWFDARRLGTSDSVHRASQRSMTVFPWHNLSAYDAPRPGDDLILAEARRHGIGDGITVPAHVPGEAHGSVSFACASQKRLAIELVAV